MDTFGGLIRRLIASLNASSLYYMFTGAIAVSYYGTPRTTMDVDIVVQTSLMEVPSLIHTLIQADVRTEEK